MFIFWNQEVLFAETLFLLSTIIQSSKLIAFGAKNDEIELFFGRVIMPLHKMDSESFLFSNQKKFFQNYKIHRIC